VGNEDWDSINQMKSKLQFNFRFRKFKYFLIPKSPFFGTLFAFSVILRGYTKILILGNDNDKVRQVGISPIRVKGNKKMGRTEYAGGL
jgi:hypothetical protein